MRSVMRSAPTRYDRVRVGHVERLEMKQRTTVLLALVFFTATAGADERPRARDIGLVVGIFPAGELNAITDVAGVRVGHATIIEGDDIRTGVTAIVPVSASLTVKYPMRALVPAGE